jgi:aminobenzoyl-glutamate utilization protein B
MAKYRPEMKKYYYDPSKYKTYLEQLGITYPTVREVGSGSGQVGGWWRASSISTSALR